MIKAKCFIVLVLVLISVHPCLADDRAKLVGTWRVISFETEYQGTDQREAIMGKNPGGYTVYTPEGRVMVLITGEGRKTAITDQGRAGLWRSMLAYSGVCRIEGDKLMTKIDASSIPEWVGAERVSIFRIDGDRLQITTLWVDAPLYPERGKMRTTVTSERVK
jgi:hypothetical protein